MQPTTIMYLTNLLNSALLSTCAQSAFQELLSTNKHIRTKKKSSQNVRVQPAETNRLLNK